MPQFVVDLRPTSALIFVEEYRKVEHGVLESVVCTYPGPITAGWAQLLVVCGCMLGGRGYDFITALFISEYTSPNHMASWTGQYTFEPYEEIFVWAKSRFSVDIRVVGKIVVGEK